MGIVSWFLGSVAGANKRAPGQQSGEAGSFPSTAATTVNIDTAMALSAFWASTRLISETIAAMPLKVYLLEEDGTRVLQSEHPLLKLFNGKVNRYQTRYEFFETMTMNLCTQGNGYALKQFSTKGEVIGLLPLMSGQMKVELERENGILKYEYHNGKEVKPYTEKQIWHPKLMGNGVIGLSPLSFGRNSIATGLAADSTTGKLFKNGGKPSAALTMPNALNPDQRKKVKENFSDMTDGNAEDNLFVLEFGMGYEQISMSPKDLDLLKSRSFQLKDVARFMGVPSILINDMDDSSVWGSGIEQIIEGFYKFGIRPYLERYEASIVTSFLPPEEWENTEVEFDFKSLLRTNVLDRVKANKDAIQGGFMTPNEARREDGLEGLPGGDNLYMQKQNVPLDELSQTDGSE